MYIRACVYVRMQLSVFAVDIVAAPSLDTHSHLQHTLTHERASGWAMRSNLSMIEPHWKREVKRECVSSLVPRILSKPN